MHLEKTQYIKLVQCPWKPFLGSKGTSSRGMIEAGIDPRSVPHVRRKFHVHWNNCLKDIILFVLNYNFYLNFIKKFRLERVKG